MTLGAIGQDHQPALQVIHLYQGAEHADKVDHVDLFTVDAVLIDPIANVRGAGNIKTRFAIFNKVLVPDIRPGQKPSESTVRLSIQKEGELCLRIELEKRVKTKVTAHLLSGPAGTDTLHTADWLADKDGYDHFVFSTVIRITLDPSSHKISRLEDEWEGLGVQMGGPGARSGLPFWFERMQQERRDLTIKAAREGW